MEKEQIESLSKIFNTPEKWGAYSDLASLRIDIRNGFFEKTKNKGEEYFNNIGKVKNWEFEAWGVLAFKWYLEEFGSESIGYLFVLTDFSLHNLSGYKSKYCITSLFEEDKYEPLRTAFPPNCKINDDSTALILESCKFIFENPQTTANTLEQSAWFAGNRPEKYLDQIIDRIDIFRKSDELVRLLKELNIEALKL